MTGLIAGELCSLSERVHRVLAPNAGFMTGPGTNSYLVGKSELALLDPGPDNDDHVHAIIAAARILDAPITRIILTHTHRDHSPAAMKVKQLTGATIHAMRPPEADPAQDRDTVIDVEVMDGEKIFMPDATLVTVHTPGHVGNHCCYWLREEKVMFTGDHLINGSTVVIIPPSGHMGDYMQSLEKMLSFELQRLLPGHGDVIENATGLIQYTLHHRRMREEKILEKLSLGGCMTVAGLTPLVYDDVPALLHPMAQLSLHAHLIRLQENGIVSENTGGWSLL